MLRLQLVSVCPLALFKYGIACMKVDSVCSRNQAERLVHIGHQLFRCSCASRVVSGRLNPAGKCACPVKSNYIVSLPAVHGNRNIFQGLQGGVRIHTDCTVNFLCGFISLFYCHDIILLFLILSVPPVSPDGIPALNPHSPGCCPGLYP